MKREELGRGYAVYIDGVNTFSADSLLLADFAGGKGVEALDLCTGCGVVALLLCKNGARAVTAVDIDKDAAKLAALSAEASNAPVTVLCSDVRALRLSDDPSAPTDGYPLITCNPPYFPQSRSPVKRRNEIRSELLLKPEELFLAAARLLSQDGEFCFCHRPERLGELTEKLAAAGLNIHRLRFVRSEPSSPPYLFLAACGKEPCPNVAADEVCIKDADGRYTEYYKKLIGEAI